MGLVNYGHFNINVVKQQVSMDRGEDFVEIFGDPAISDVSDSGKFSLSSRLDQSNSTLSMDYNPPIPEDGYFSDRVNEDDEDHMEEDPHDDIPLDQHPEILPPFEGVNERFDFWQERGFFNPAEEAPEEDPPAALINQDDPHFGLQNPIVQALVIAGLGHIVPAENIVMPMDVDPEEI